MKNRLLLALIVIAAIFPFAATVVELIKDPTAAIVLAALTVITIAIVAGAMLYRPKRTAEIDTPLQVIPTIKMGRNENASKKPANRNKEAAAPSTDPKKQRAR